MPSEQAALGQSEAESCGVAVTGAAPTGQASTAPWPPYSVVSSLIDSIEAGVPAPAG